MFFFGGKINGLSKGSSFTVLFGRTLKSGGSGKGKVLVMVPVIGLVSMLIKYINKDRYEDFDEDLVRQVGCRCGGILVELLQSSEDVGISVRI